MQGRIGVQIYAPDAAGLLQGIVHAEELGIPEAWLTTGMFAAAGFPEAQQGEWSDAMIAAVVVYGSEAAVTRRLRDLLAMGASELMVSPVAAGLDAAATIERTLHLIGNLAATSA